jgi:hypothetical protein
MDHSRFDMISRRFAERRLSRRQALAGGGASLAATGLATIGLSNAGAQEATPAPTGTEKTEFLFVQSFQSGSIVPKDGEAGTWTLTLEQGLGQTIYFSDRPERIVGVSPTDKFLKGLGFSNDNPPNAALLFENDKGEEDISVVELFNPQYDTATHTATYDIQLLNEYAGLDMTFQQQPTEPPDAQASFGTAHLFIDDCADGTVICTSGCSSTEYYGDQPICGTLGPMGFCYDSEQWGCYPCEPSGRGIFDCHDADACELNDYWTQQCNENVDACNGNCVPNYQ